MLEIEKLTRRFGHATVVDDVSFTVTPGRVTGFVGGNGAGKTTTMRIILGVLAASSGEVRWQGRPISREDRGRFGYMPEERGLYPKQPILDQLVFFGRLHGLTRAEATARSEALLDRLELGGRHGDRLDTLSLGNQQRVQIAAALVHEPVALVLDEPFSGLDPLAVDTMAELLRDEMERGVPVLFSSHQLELVEQLCDDLVILSSGRVVAAGSVEELRRGAGELHRLVMEGGQDAGWVRDVPGLDVRDVDGSTALLAVDGAATTHGLLQEALSRGGVREFSVVVPALSDVYREVVR